MRNPRLFPLTRHLHEGEPVQYKLCYCGEGEGVIELIWLGKEETVDIRCSDGRLVRASPALKDEIVPLVVSGKSECSGKSERPGFYKY